MADTPRRRRTAVIAAVALGLGGALVARAAWVHDPALHVSPVVGYAVGAVLVAAALALVAQAWEHPRAQAALAAFILVGMSVVGAWIALFADPDRCRGGVLGCRAAFGVGALLTTFMAVVALRQWLAGSTRRSGP